MDEMTMLAEMRAEMPPARAVARASARGQLLARIEATRQPRRRAFPGWGNRRVGLLAGLAGAAVTAAVLILGVFGSATRVEPAAAQILREAARTAAVHPPLVPGPGQFVFTRSVDSYLLFNPGWSVLVPTERETWISLDGSRKGRIREVLGRPRFVSGDQRAAWVAAGSPPLPREGSVEETTISGGDIVSPAGLPTDPATLLEKIEARRVPGVNRPPGDAETFALIGELLRQPYLAGTVRAALFEAAAKLPRVESVGEVRDSVGRAGLGIALTDGGRRQELIIDPESSVLLGERETLARADAFGFDAPAGTTIGSTAYLGSRVVDSVGPKAPAGAGAFDNSVGCYEEPSLKANTAILHGNDPIATCEEVWREGALGTGGAAPPLVACTEDGTPALVFPGTGPEVCSRLGLVPIEPGGNWSD